MRILLVSPDGPEAALERALAERGHQLEHTSNCQSAADKVLRGQHEVVILDLFFKRLTALELIGQIRTRSQTVAIITTSPETEDNRTPPGLDALGIHAHLSQPLEPDLLLTTLDEIPTTTSAS